MLEGLSVSEDANRSGGASLYGNHGSFVSQEAVLLAAKDAETFLQALANELRHPEMQGRRHEAWGIARGRKVIAETSVHKVRHTLSRCGLSATALLPAEAFEVFLEGQNRKIRIL